MRDWLRALAAPALRPLALLLLQRFGDLSRCAAKLGLVDRGTVEIGKKADLVLFSAERIRETATFEQPHQYAEGVELVVLNGRIVVDGAEHTGALSGRVLRRA